uniref:HTH psq-type domain-containing protein n=1 Tax=Chrysemys picta bellii TaxID=8478 RepID=A0A8C3P5U7_CHRPI
LRPSGPPTSSGAQPKKQRCVPTLEEKLAVLDLLRDGMSIANVAHKYGHNESSIRVMSQVREKTSVKTEKALNLWLEDMNYKNTLQLINSTGIHTSFPLNTALCWCIVNINNCIKKEHGLSEFK